MDAILIYFQDKGCKTLYALVDRYNSPSWNMFLNKGFMPFEFHRQFEVFGWRIILLWWAVRFFIGSGHFILRKTDKEDRLAREEAAEGWHYLLAWLGSSIITWIVGPWHAAPLVASIPLVLGVVGTSIFIHELAHKLIARFFGIKTIFKANELGLVFSAFISLVTGGFYPSYGSTYIKQKDWSYNKNLREMGLVYAGGSVVSLVLASYFLALSQWTNMRWLVNLAIVGFWTNFPIGSFNLLRAPMFDGNKIFLWNKIVWSLLVMGYALLLGVKILL